MKENIFLIGMSGVGKSYYGRRIAKELGFFFIDTDDLLENQYGNKDKLLDTGEENFMKAEEKILLSIPQSLEKTIVASGGSCIYTNKGMEHIKRFTNIVYLMNSIENIAGNVELKNRGVVGLSRLSPRALLEERANLYEKYSDFQIDLRALQRNQKKEESLIHQHIVKIVSV